MAIKVKHEGNVTSRLVASRAGGRGKRASEDGKAWMQIAASSANAGNQQLRGASASPVSPGQAHVQLTHAQTGAAPGIIGNHVSSVPNGGMGGGRTTTAQGRTTAAGVSGGVDGGDMKITGYSAFTRPDKESQWDGTKWKRAWLPGEKEAEAQQRIGDVKNRQQMEINSFNQGLRDNGKAAERQAANDEWNRRRQVLRSEQDEELVRKGTHEWGYTADAQRQVNDIRKAYNDAVGSGRFSQDELDALKTQTESKIANIPMQAVARKDAQALFNQNTFRDDAGRIFTTDGKLVFDPAEAEAKRSEYAARRQDMEDKRFQDAVLKLNQGRKVTMQSGVDDEDKPVYKDQFQPYSQDEQNAILRQLFPARYANVQPSPQPTAQPVPVQPTAQPQPQNEKPGWMSQLGW